MKNIIILFLVLLFSTENLYSQNIESTSYNLEFVGAKYIDDKKPPQIILVLKYEPKDGKEFKPIISAKITYQFDNKGIKTEILENPKHSLTFTDRGVNQKNPEIYEWIKDKIDINQEKEFGLLIFYLNGITKKYVQNMSFTYGLWEPDNLDLRIEKKFEFQVLK